jgi:tetratricopeptide (TPR) repeat protein
LASIVLAGCVDPATDHRVKANAFLRGGDAKTAVKECDLGLASKPDDAALLIMRGKALYELDDLDGSRGAFERAIAVSGAKADRSLSEAYLGLGKVASRQKQWAEARTNFETLTRFNDKDAYSHLNTARTCLELGDVPCAIQHGEMAGHLRGDEEGVLYTLGVIYLAAGKRDEAELTFKHIGEVVPGAASSPYGAALVAAKAGDKARAVAELTEAVKRKLPNPSQIAADPGLVSLKGDPAFEALVAQAASAR